MEKTCCHCATLSFRVHLLVHCAPLPAEAALTAGSSCSMCLQYLLALRLLFKGQTHAGMRRLALLRV